VQRANFLDVLRGMQCVLEKKSDQENTPIRMQLSEDGKLTMSISDGSIFMESVVEVSTESYSADLSELFLPVALVYDLIRRLEVMQVRFVVTEKSVTLRHSEGDFLISKLISMASYMHNTNIEAPTFRLNSHSLLEVLRLLKTTMAVEDIRDQFKGISVIIEGDQMTLWSTDGIKMCIAKLQIDSAESLNVEGIWTRKFVETLLTISGDVPVEFQMSARHVRCKVEDTVIFSPMINAKLLDHRSIINETEEPNIYITVDATYLQKKLERMMILTDSDGSVLIDLREQPSISCSNKQKSDSAFEKIEVSVKGEKGKFFINPYIITNFLRNFKTQIELLYFTKSNMILLRKKDEKYPVYITKAMTVKEI